MLITDSHVVMKLAVLQKTLVDSAVLAVNFCYGLPLPLFPSSPFSSFSFWLAPLLLRALSPSAAPRCPLLSPWLPSVSFPFPSLLPRLLATSVLAVQSSACC